MVLFLSEGTSRRQPIKVPKLFDLLSMSHMRCVVIVCCFPFALLPSRRTEKLLLFTLTAVRSPRFIGTSVYSSHFSFLSCVLCRFVASLQGKKAAAKVFQPYPPDFPKPQPPQYLGPNVYGLIHNQQRQNYAMHKLLTSLQAYFARPSPKEVSRRLFELALFAN